MTTNIHTDPITLACAIARGELTPDPGAAGVQIRAAHRELAMRGSVREEWYRMVWRDGGWRYLGDRRLEPNRKDTTYDIAYPGELIVQHDRGGPVDAAYLVVATQDKPLRSLDFTRRRDGQLGIALPDGSTVVRPDPRR